MTLGITEDTSWQQATVVIDPGDLLVLYTDGLTDGETRNGVFFGEQGLVTAVHTLIGQASGTPLSASRVQEHILNSFQTFLDGSPRSDDLTLLVLLRS
jgi:sigma-B regulation protein RsbU (phosphoserine phosphatase)